MDASTASPSTTAAPPACEGRILIVDDNRDIVALTQRTLRSRNFETFTAFNGREALEAVRERPIDVVLLDVMLPEIDGLEVCRTIKGHPQHRKIMVLLITGCGSVDHRVKGLEAGADDYITKPFHLIEVLARVRSAMRIKHLNDEIEETHRRLLEAQKERLRSEKMATIGLLATGIAHEFNNIMSGILGFAQLARKSAEFKDQLVDVTIIQAERAMKIANSLSSFYRPASGRSAVDVRREAEGALCLVVKELKEREIEVVEEFDADVRPIPSQPGQLQEVILNLIINAIDAVGERGRIAVAVRQQDGCVELSVSDNGPGIAPETMDHIFDPFFTTKGALGGGTRSGSGLGLSLSYNIVASHAGRFEVRSEPGRGTTFTVRLPCGEFPPVAREQEAAATETPPPACEASGRLVIADADHSVEGIAQRYLRGLDVSVCLTWEELFTAMAEVPAPARVLLDTELPGEVDFEEGFQRLSAAYPAVPVLLTSRNLSAAPLRRCLPQAAGHLIKPYTVENLTNLLDLEGAFL
jgi:signal transduction histidine kinase